MNNPANISIRPLTQADERFLGDMLYQAIFVPDGYPKPDPSIVKQPDLAKYVQDWGLEHDHGFLAIDADAQQPVGAVWSRLFTGDARWYGYVDDETPELSMAVVPACRGRGVGTLLMSGILKRIEKDYDKISLSVSEGNPAIHLYERFGFTAFAAAGDSITMVKAF